MSSPHADRIESELFCTITTPRQTVSVTIGYGGFVKDVKCPTRAYRRMAPDELASAVPKAITDAQSQIDAR